MTTPRENHPVLSVQNLTIGIPSSRGFASVVEKIHFSLESGSILGIAGESGSGKTLTACAIAGLLPATLNDVPLDFDTLQPHGSFIGSAAVVVLSDKDSARDAALNMLRFFEDESCGQCTPCRVGCEKAVKLMSAARWDQALLEDLCEAMADSSICGLGQAAPNPIRMTIKHFPEEI